MTTQFDEQVSNTYGNQEPDADARLMATLIYVLSFFTSLIAPLIIWLIKRDESPFVKYYGLIRFCNLTSRLLQRCVRFF